nr:small ubiquitin-related modifier 2-like [Ipomoea trifida]
MVGTVKTENGYIKLKVQMQNKRDQYFTIRRNEALQAVLVGYCKLEGIEFEATRFLLENKRVQGWDTPEELAMEEEDVIDAFQDMLGGGVAENSYSFYHPNGHFSLEILNFQSSVAGNLGFLVENGPPGGGLET